MAVLPYTIGGGTYVNLNGGSFEKTNGMNIPPGTAQFSLSFRAGHEASLKKLNGKVLRGAVVTGNLRSMWGDASPNVAVSLAPDVTKQRYQTVVNLPSPPAVRYLDAPFSLTVPTTSIPLGRFGSGAGNPNTNQWAGIATAGISVIHFHAFDGDTAIRLDKRDIYASDPPRWVILSAPTSLTEGQTAGTDVVIHVAYPDGEPVVGLTVGFYGTEQINIQNASGYWTHEVLASTDSAGVVRVKLQAIKGGSGALTIKCADSRSEPSYFDPMFETVLSIGAETREVGGVTCVVVPPVPAVPPILARRDEINVREWDAGANSITRLDGDVELKFNMEAVVGVVVGLTNNMDPSPDFHRMTHAFSFGYGADGAIQARIMESGKAMQVVATGYAPEDEFIIYRINGAVTYYINDNLVYSSRVPSSGPLATGSSLYATGDYIPGGGSGPDPDPGEEVYSSFRMTAGTANDNDAFAIYYDYSGSQVYFVCDSDLYNALLVAGSVELTGVAADAGDDNTCGSLVPYLSNDPAWTEYLAAPWTMDLYDTGSSLYYIMNNNNLDPMVPPGSYYWIRINVDGVDFYGYAPMGSVG